MSSLSAVRERMVQYVQDFGSPSTLLDFLFQHIPLKQSSSHGIKKKGSAVVTEATNAATTARPSPVTNSLYFFVEALWPIAIEEMATLAGAFYGLMLCVLPTHVRNWFTSLRDRFVSFSIEAFTTTWYRPQLLVDDFSQDPPLPTYFKGNPFFVLFGTNSRMASQPTMNSNRAATVQMKGQFVVQKSGCFS